MINVEKLKPVLEGHKTYFSSHWYGEKYKWEAINLLKNSVLHHNPLAGRYG